MNIEQSKLFFDECYNLYLCYGNDFIQKFERKLSYEELGLISTWYETGSTIYCSSYLNPRIHIFCIKENSEMYKLKMNTKEIKDDEKNISVNQTNVNLFGKQQTATVNSNPKQELEKSTPGFLEVFYRL